MNRYLVTIALLLVFGTSAFMSIYGLTAVFVGISAVIICLGIGMESGKILTVVYLHRNWGRTGWIGRIFYIAVVIVPLTAITSVEVLGFLSQRHASAVNNLKAVRADISSLRFEAKILKDQIDMIDETLSGLPRGYVSKRFREREKAGYAEKQNRLLEISRKQARLRASEVTDPAFIGPIFAVGRIFDIDENRTVSIFILFLTAVLEPLSIGLAIATSAVWRTADQTAKVAEKPAKVAHPYTIELKAIAERHNLKIEDVAKITDRKFSETVEGWLDEKPLIPIKALRLLRRRAAKQPAMKTYSKGPIFQDRA